MTNDSVKQIFLDLDGTISKGQHRVRLLPSYDNYHEQLHIDPLDYVVWDYAQRLSSAHRCLGHSAILSSQCRFPDERKEISCWMSQLLGCSCTFYWRCWSNRTLFIVSADEEIKSRLQSFSERWGSHGKLLHTDHN